MQKVWFITGCSTGIGRTLVDELLKNDQMVVATARNPEKINIKHTDTQLLLCKLDVTKKNEIKQSVDSAIKKFGRIDVLVNNAGFGYYGTQEEADLEHVQEMFNVNVFGALKVTQRILPLMRHKKSGIIVNISSIGGRVPLPLLGFYHASKFALEALSEVLYFETSGFGIRIIIVEPGGHKTEFSQSGMRSQQLSDPRSPYANVVKLCDEVKKKMVPAKGSPINVVKSIISATKREIPFQRCQVGLDADTLIKIREKSDNDKEYFKTMYDLYGLGIDW